MSRAIRVAHVVATAASTGVEAHLLALLASFDRSQVESVLFVPGPGPLVERLRAHGLAVEEGAPARKLAFASERSMARRFHGAFDIVHAHGPRAAFWAERAARRAAVPAFVATVHELRWRTLARGIRRSLWLALEDAATTRARAVIAVSEAARRELIARRPELEERTVVVPGSTPLMLELERLPRADPGAAGGPFRLVTVGRFDRVKGYDRLLAALASLAARGVDFSLDLVGAGPLESELRALSRRLGIAEHVTWQVDAAAVPASLAAAHAFVTATREETFGIAVLEAMAVGLPVLAPAAGALPELVVDGETGRLVAPDPEASLPDRLAVVLAEWAVDPPGRARLGEAGRRRARERFGPGPLARGVTEVYRRILAQASRAQ